MQIIADSIGQLKLGAAQTYRNLAVFPLIRDGQSAADYVLLDDALEEKLARVTEISEGGSVPELRFENQGDRSVLLVDGDELVGARQNRILNLSVLVAAHTGMAIPVSCVERGRWQYRTRDFQSAKRTLFAKARAAKMGQVTASLRRTGSRESDQHAVWEGISAKFDALSSGSPTEAMGDLYEQQRIRLTEFRRSFQAGPSQVGAVFAVNGKPVGAEFFDAAATFERFLQKLLESYAIDAIEDEGDGEDVPSLEEAAAFLRRVQIASAEKFEAIGEGEDVRLRGRGIAGGALVKADRVVHLAAFAEVR